MLGATVGTVRGFADLLGLSRRGTWVGRRTLHIEVHGVCGRRGGEIAARVERALERHPGVHWARVNAPAARVIIGLADPQPPTRELVTIVKRAEGEPADVDEEAREDELKHPADGVRGTRLLSTLAADLTGFGMSLITRIAPLAPVPAELAALPAVVDHHPGLKKWLARTAHSGDRSDSLTSIVGAVAHGLAGGGDGAVIDAVQRVGQWREARAHHRAWCAAEGKLITGPESAAAGRVEGRPEPPEGDIERYQRTVLALGATAAVAAVPFAGPRKAAALGLSALPKSAELGRTTFATQLGRVLAARGVLVMDRAVLTRLDLVDTVVLDQSAVETGRLMLSELVPLDGSERAEPPEGKEIAERAWALFDPARPSSVRADGDWRLGPLEKLGIQDERAGKERERLERRGVHAVLGLALGDRVEAVLGLSGEPVPGIHTLTAATRRSGLAVVTTENPVTAVKELHDEGKFVLLVSRERTALGTADLAVGVHREGEPAPWGAHLLAGDDVGAVALLVEAVAATRTLNTQNIRIAKAATGVGVVTALRAGRTTPAERALRAVNAGGVIGMANARRCARGLRPPDAVVPETVPWHLMPVEAVLGELGREGGLDEEEARERSRSGARTTEKVSLGSAFLAELANPLTPVLAGGAALSAAVGSPSDAVLVAGVTGLSALVGSVQQVRTQRQLAELLSRTSVSATVRRSGGERVISADDLVKGDLVALAPGDVVPADCRLVDAEGLEVDESSLTGESLPVAKDPAPVVAPSIAARTSMVYEGTTVAAGQASAIVVAVGDETEAGKSMAAAREGAPATGVESRLTELTEKGMPLAVGAAAAVAGAGLLRGVPLRESLGAAVNLAVASVPEGLPFLVNAAQLAAARRLAGHGVLVRNPRSIEALGRVDVLCFDKTGTLTEGRLRVSELDDGTRRCRADALAEPHRRVLAAALRATPETADPDELPHPTDRAVATAAKRYRMTAATGAQRWEPVAVAPFEPSRGYHAAVGSTSGQLLLSVKGAPEEILPRCALDARTRKRLNARMRELAGSGQRVLAVAERVLGDRALPASTESDNGKAAATEIEDGLVTGLTFRGFVGIADPVRGTAADAAARLREAGVHIVMITGDHPVTGEAVATEINGEGKLTVATGDELEELDDERLAERLPRVDVIARCSPAQKVRIIKTYQRIGNRVAMTGDGANDAPAIRLADVGIALGGHGTPAARAAADLVVTDDRLETIIAALVEGRAMWASVRSALGVLLGGNLGEIAFNVLGAALTGRSPLNARQLLLVNLLTDLAPALAIALREPDEASVASLLDEGPESSLGQRLYREIGVRAGATTLGATAAWTMARFTGRRRRASTVALAALVVSQLGQTLVTGWRSPSVLASGLGSAAVLAAIVQTPGVSQFFGCTPLGPAGWGMAVGSAGAAGAFGAVLGQPVSSGSPPEEGNSGAGPR